MGFLFYLNARKYRPQLFEILVFITIYNNHQGELIMGKKRRMIAHPQKFGEKHINHPIFRPTTDTTPVTEEVTESKVEPEVELKTTIVKTPEVEKKKSGYSKFKKYAKSTSKE